ncbi:radical SAM/SPASM domain-containing protein [Candidatus Omnitrophota bacterium]
MIHKFFGIKTEQRQGLYKAFCALPKIIKNPLINIACWIGRHQIKSFSTPPRLIWYVTSRCNARCSHCFYGRHINQKDEFTIDEFKRVVRSLDTKLRAVNLTGGEPFLHGDLPELCRTLAEISKTDLITLPTNGSKPASIELSLQKILKTAKLRVNVQVSLEGTRDVHDQICGIYGIFDNAVETVQRLKKLKSHYKRLNNISVITTLSLQNEKCLSELMRFVREELGVFHKIQFIRGAHTDVFGIELCDLSELDPLHPEKPHDIVGVVNFLSRDILRYNKTLLARKQIELLYQAASILTNKKPSVNCLAGRIDGVIFANGDVAICELTKPFANLRDFSFDFHKLWNSSQANEMRRRTQKCFCTHPCNLTTSMSFDPHILKKLSVEYIL